MPPVLVVDKDLPPVDPARHHAEATFGRYRGHLAGGIAMEPGEEVERELLDRGELHLVRKRVPKPRAKQCAASSKS